MQNPTISPLTMYCDPCGDDHEFQPRWPEQTVTIRKEQVTAPVPMLACPECGDVQPHPDHDPMVPLYDAYRRKHGLLAPEEIKAIREQYDLSHQAFARLLGMGEASLYRYERGALQDQAHDELIRCCSDPRHMEELVCRRGDRLTDLQRRRFEEAIARLPQPIYTETWTETCGLDNEYAGFRRFDYARYAYMVRKLCAIVDGAFETKLNKLLFYADFLACKTIGQSISGSPYRAIQHGPVPADYGALRDRLEEEGFIELREVDFGEHAGTRVEVGNRLPVFPQNWDPREDEIIEFVATHFHRHRSRDIRDESHREAAWAQTPQKKLIPYIFARQLSLELPSVTDGPQRDVG